MKLALVCRHEFRSTTRVLHDGQVVFVVRNFKCPKALEELIAADGYDIERLDSLDMVATLLPVSRVRAVLVGARPFTQNERRAARLCRLVAPQTALVAVANDSTPLWRLKLALDCHATALLLWPTEPDLVEAALASGARVR